jgi:hypothetical protein
VRAENRTGYACVHLGHPGKPKPYQAQVKRSGKDVHLGSFATAEEAALCIARSAGRAATQPHVTGSDDGGGDDAGEEGEEEFEVLDAVEVLDAWTDDYDDTCTCMCMCMRHVHVHVIIYRMYMYILIKNTLLLSPY